MIWVLGVDPGATTGFVLLNEARRVLYSLEVKFEGKGRGRFNAISHAVGDVVGRIVDLRWESERDESGKFAKVWTVIEDVTDSHVYGAKKGNRRTSHAIASIQRDFASLVMAWLHADDSVIEDVILAPVAKWYPRMDGRLIAKKDAIHYLRQSCRGDNLQSEHLVMAYGIASWGLRHLRTLEQIRRARPT